MGILPKDEKLSPKTEPRNFFIYGKTMSGLYLRQNDVGEKLFFKFLSTPVSSKY